MNIGLLLNLLLAHLIGDFALQTSESCKHKRDKKWGSVYHYYHAVIVFVLAWLASWDWAFWWCALAIGATHFVIDMWKSYCKDNVIWFTVDQLLHVAVMVGAAWLWCSMSDWRKSRADLMPER